MLSSHNISWLNVLYQRKIEISCHPALSLTCNYILMPGMSPEMFVDNGVTI